MTNPKILGIDPATIITGYAVIQDTKLIDIGTIQVPGAWKIGRRLSTLRQGMIEVIREFNPDEIAIEKLHFDERVSKMTAAIMGHCYGVFLQLADEAKIPVFEYQPSETKQAVTGKGNASKSQVQTSLTWMFKLNEYENVTLDATDALAAAYCHYLAVR